MSSPTPTPERSSVSTPGENVAYIASTASNPGSPEPAAPPPNPDQVDGAATVKSGGVPLTAWQSNAAELAQLLVEKQLGPFQIEASLGTGGMAAVFRAYDVQLDRKVALKILPPVLAVHPDHVQRFEREAKVTAKLDHEHVARVHQYGQDQGLHYIAYEFVEGTNLRDLMAGQGGRLTVADAVRFTLQAARGLAHTAARGVIHRDIKPSNLVITAEGKVKLVDLGLARNSLTEEAQDLTHSGATLGTFDYLAPEQAIDPRAADVRSDIYSLGCTLYHAVTGQAPVPQGTAARKLHSHQLELPTDPRELNPEVPPALVSVLERMLAKRPEDRYQSADELVQDLERLSVGSEVRPAAAEIQSAQEASPWWVWVAGLFLLVASVVGYEWWTQAPADHQANAIPDLLTVQQERKAPEESESEQRQAASVPITIEVQNGAELLKALQGTTGGTIWLRGTDYLLVASDESGAALSVRGGDWHLRPIEGTSPVLRLQGSPAESSRAETLFEVRTGSLQLRQVRLETSTNRQSLFVVLPPAQLTVLDCELVQSASVEGRPAQPLVRVLPEVEATAPAGLQFRGCLLSGGDVALDHAAAGLVQWQDCWIGPYRQVVHFPELSGAAVDAKRVVSWQRCCVMQAKKSCFHVAGGGATQLEIEQCLFSRSGPTQPFSYDDSVWLVKEEGANLELRTSENLFHRIPAFYATKPRGGDLQVQARDWSQMRAYFPRFRDTGQSVLFKTPWAELQPWKRYEETRQLEALLPKDDYRDNCPETLLGRAFRSAVVASRANAPAAGKQPRTLTVDGRGDEPGTFTTINSALGSITDEEETTIVVQQQGNVAVKPSELGNSRVILKAGEGFSPTLVFHRDTVSGPDGDTALFRLHDGDLTLDRVKARLEPLRDPARSLALVSISGTGRCRLKDSIVTLKTGGELLAMVCLVADPTGMMAPLPGKAPRHGTARLELQDSFVRGAGEVLHVQTSRPFVAQTQNCGIVLDGAAFVVEGNRADMSMPAEPAQLGLERTTLHATRGVVQLRGTPGLPQLVTVRCQVSQSLLSSDLQPLIRVDSSQTDPELRRRLTWTGKRNVYAAPGPLLLWQALDRDTMATPYDATLWGELWGGDDEQGQVLKSMTFVGSSKSLGFAEWEPTDLTPKLDAAMGMALREVGMAPELLPSVHTTTP